MNHDRDIDDGLEEFREKTQRDADERRYMENPRVFTGCLDPIEHEDALFTCRSVDSLELHGGLTGREDGPYHYEGGTATLTGTLERHGEVRVHVRWSGPTWPDFTVEPTDIEREADLCDCDYDPYEFLNDFYDLDVV